MALTDLSVIVEDRAVVDWTIQGNNFLRKNNPQWKQATHYWGGLLFLFGKHRKWDNSADIDDLLQVEFRLGGPRGTLQYTLTLQEIIDANRRRTKKSLYWIQVKAPGAGDARYDPMTVDDLKKARLHRQGLQRKFNTCRKYYPGGMMLWLPREADSFKAASGFYGDRWQTVFTVKREAGGLVELWKYPKNTQTRQGYPEWQSKFDAVNPKDIDTIVFVMNPQPTAQHGDLMDPPQRP